MSVFSTPYFGWLYSSCLKDAGQTEVYVHTLRLHEKILPAGSDLVSTHCSKEMVLVFNKDIGKALNIACNTQSDMLQLSKATQITVLMLKVFQGKIKKEKKSRWISSTNFKNINKYHID